MISLLNDIVVSFFGCILSASFCGAGGAHKGSCRIAIFFSFLLIIEGVLYFLQGAEMVRICYPIISHLPLFLILWSITGRGLCSLTAVLTAYLCCQLRRWIALLLTLFCHYDQLALTMVELIITLPLLIFLLRITAPAVRRVLCRPAKDMWTFAVIPTIYYVFDYTTAVYTGLLYEGNFLISEFMPTCCCVCYLFFANRTMEQENFRHQVEQERNALKMQTKQALQEIEFLRDSQEQAAAYRHDLRHHLQYVYSCMENQQYEQGQKYIRSVWDEIEAQKVVAYCENETANLILTAYQDRFSKANIPWKIQCSLSKSSGVAPVDLCVLLANALENALHECQYLSSLQIPSQVEITAYEKSNQLFLQISNTCRSGISLRDGLPTTRQEGHGIGVKSICAIIKKYQGIYSFSIQDNKFILRIVL